MEILIAWNIIVFLMYGLDKYNAIKGNWRISEKNLLISAFLMGGLGAYLGMQVFRHKTKHIKFTFFVPLALISNIAVIYFMEKGLL